MSALRKNIIVGITAVVALLLLGWMILRFSDQPFRWFAKPQIAVTIKAPSAEGLSEGSEITYKGVGVGRVVSIRRSPDQSSVIIEAMLDAKPPLPGNLEAQVRTAMFGSVSQLSLVLVEAGGATTQPVPGAPPEPRPVGQLQNGQVLVGRYAGAGLLPKEFTDLAVDLRNTSEEIRALSRKIRESDIIPQLAAAISSVRSDVDKIGQTIDAINGIVTDRQVQANIRQTVANLRATSETATRVGENLEKLSRNANTKLDELSAGGNKLLTNTNARIDELSKQMTERMVQLAKVLQNVESATRKLNEGNGSVAQLLNNPTFYENLLDTSKELKVTIADFQRLVEQWEQEGVTLRLGGKK